MTANIRPRFIACVLASMLVVASCQKSTPPAPAAADNTAPMPQATGISQGLTKRTEAPLYNIERIGAVVAPLGVPDVSIPATNDLVILGWAVDPINKDSGSGVDVVIDGVPYLATAGVERGDVSTQFKVPGYRTSGYTFTIPASVIGKGTHRIAIRVISRDGKSYLESPAMKFSLT